MKQRQDIQLEALPLFLRQQKTGRVCLIHKLPVFSVG